MVTDDERRRVARKLREYASWDGEEDCLVDCADWGERVLNLLGCGDTEGECYAALADLIDPPTQCPYYHSDRHHCSAYDDVVDRDALLALADEMQRELDECESDHEIVGKLQYQIESIRTACGEASLTPCGPSVYDRAVAQGRRHHGISASRVEGGRTG